MSKSFTFPTITSLLRFMLLVQYEYHYTSKFKVGLHSRCGNLELNCLYHQLKINYYRDGVVVTGVSVLKNK